MSPRQNFDLEFKPRQGLIIFFYYETACFWLGYPNSRKIINPGDIIFLIFQNLSSWDADPKFSDPELNLYLNSNA